MTKALLTAALVGPLVMFPAMAEADACRDALVKVMVGSQDRLPSQSVITTVTTGQKPVINRHFSNGAGDWMTEMVEPSDQPWSLAVGKILYTSSDKGKTWKKARNLDDPGHDPDAIRREQEATARAAQNILCGSEEIGGTRLEKIEADLVYPQMNMTTRQTYWIHPETGRTVRSHGVMRMAGFETAVTQVIEYPPKLVLPQPE